MTLQANVFCPFEQKTFSVMTLQKGQNIFPNWSCLAFQLPQLQGSPRYDSATMHCAILCQPTIGLYQVTSRGMDPPLDRGFS